MTARNMLFWFFSVFRSQRTFQLRNIEAKFDAKKRPQIEFQWFIKPYLESKVTHIIVFQSGKSSRWVWGQKDSTSTRVQATFEWVVSYKSNFKKSINPIIYFFKQFNELQNILNLCLNSDFSALFYNQEIVGGGLFSPYVNDCVIARQLWGRVWKICFLFCLK